MIRLLIVLSCCLYSILAMGDASRELTVSNRPGAFGPELKGLKLKELKFDEAGFLKNTSTDGFFTLQGFDLPRGQACNLLLDLEFAQPLFRPAMFEIFWSTSSGAFAESQKARFLVNHQQTIEPTRFILPLCKMYRFSGNLNSPNLQRNITGFRFDFPVNRTVSLKISRFSPLSATELESALTETVNTTVFLEPYEKIPGRGFTSIDVVMAKVFFALEDGLSRLAGDRWFLLFWLTMILICLLLLVRSFVSVTNKSE